MSSPQEFLDRIGAIVGTDVCSGQFMLSFSLNNPAEARAVLLRIRTMQKELRLVKQEVNHVIAAIKSEYATATAKIGSGFLDGVTTGFFGRRVAGRVHADERDRLRRARIEAVGQYDGVKRILDELNAKLDGAKGQIQLSPEFRGASVGSSPDPPQVTATPRPARYFAYLDDQVKGPYSKEQMAALHDVGTIWDESLCCVENTTEWKPCTAVFGGQNGAV